MAVRANRCKAHQHGNCFFCCETQTGGYLHVSCFGDRLRTIGGDLSIKVATPEGSAMGTLDPRSARALAYAILAQQGVTL